MSGAYLYTALGVVFISVAVSFLVPEGKLKKSVYFVLRLVCIAALITPLYSAFNINTDNGESQTDYSYVCEVYSMTQSRYLTQKVNTELEIDCACVVDVAFTDGKIMENGVTVTGSFVESETIDTLTEYLKGLGYINITVNGQDG